MKSSSRWLLGFGIAITLLIVATVVLVIATGRGGGVSPLPEDTPEGTVQRFLLAIQDRDYEKAYSYLTADEKGQKQTYQMWLQSLPPDSSRPEWKATLGRTTVTGNTATVDVTVDVFRPGGPFSDPVRTQRVSLRLTRVNNVWYIVQPPGFWWLY